MSFLPWYKRKYLIDPKIQLKVILLLVGISTVAAFCICFIAYERLIKLGVLFNHASVAPAMVPQAFQDLANSLMYRLIAIVVAMIVIFCAAGIFLTHQLAGPIWKLQHQLENFLTGQKIPPIKFRKGDAFQELPPLVNKLMTNYKE